MTKMTMTTTKRDCYVSRYGTVSVALQVFLCSFILLPSCSALECLSGWESGEIGDGGGKLVNIPEDWINDGYCDCPMDGKDEPDTNACSGSQYWPGISLPDSDDSTTTSLFQCPEQPNLLLPHSRINDGICDCCDGADEVEGTCPDICEQVLKEERETREKLLSDFASGYEKRRQVVEEFASLRETTLQQLQQLQEEKDNNVPVDEVKQQLKALKHSHMTQRMNLSNDVMTPEMLQLVQGLDSNEKRDIIINSCQVSAEVLESDTHITTCVPLRLAALDVGVSWGEEDYENPGEVYIAKATNLDDADDEITFQIAELLFDNALSGEGGDKDWLLPNVGSQQRRRLMEYDDDEYFGDDDYHSHYDDSEEDYHGGYALDDDEEYVPPKRRHNYKNKKSSSSSSQQKYPALVGKSAELVESIKETSFFSNRVAFLERSNAINEQISQLMDGNSEEDDDDVDQEDAESEESENTESDDDDKQRPPNIDPAAFTMVRSTLRRKEEKIELGFRWAASASLFFSSILRMGESAEDGDGAHGPNVILSDEELDRLLVGTIYHGKLSTLDVWKIVNAVVVQPSSSSDSSGEDAHGTCVSPWARICPPQTVEREGSSPGIYPPSILIQAAEVFCSEQEDAGKLEELCSADVTAGDAENDGSGSVSIPTSVPDGYYGYMVPISRDKRKDEQVVDPLVEMFAGLDSLTVDEEQYDSLQRQLSDLENRKKELEKTISNTWKDIGGRDGSSMGVGGELHSMSNECFAIEAGKYTYEICIFGKASQKDNPDDRSGTDLGKWTKMDVNDDTHERTMYWERGAKCWNGPQRSATVHVTCGSETKLISADEPDTCRYVFVLESPIGCDDKYKERMGL